MDSDTNEENDGLGRLVNQSLVPVFQQIDEMTEIDVIVRAEAVSAALQGAMAEVARRRRAAVRSLRGSGWLLREIAEQTGMSHQRISQIETGYSRKRGE